MKIMFSVQGDGRGHMTQAIAAAQALERANHEVVAVTIGTSPSRTIPEFFRDRFGDRLIPIPSPGFAFHGSRGVALVATLRQTLCGLGRYRESLAALTRTIEQTEPDLIVNFLEPLVGAFNLLRPHSTPVIAVGHQFMLDHPTYVRSGKFRAAQWGMRQYVRLTGARSTKLALSCYPAASSPKERLFVCPPLLRQELFSLPQDAPGRYLLVYVLNQAYTQDVLRWHTLFPGIEVHCFCEKPKVEPVWRYDATLTFHKLDGAKFLRMMAECRAVACTAGFESMNEAAWLGKPTLVVPVENHVEQHLNALDAERAGLAIAGDRLDLTPLLRADKPRNLEPYRAWLRRAETTLLSVVEGMTRGQHRRPVPAFPAPALAGHAA